MSMENSPSGSQDITNSLRSTPEINSFPATSYESVSSISQNPLICSSLNEKNPTSILGKSAKKKGLHQNRSLRNKIKNQSQDFPEPFSLPKCNLPNNARVLKIISLWVTKYYIDFKTLDTLKIALRDFINKIIENENEIEKKSILFTRANMIATTIKQNETEMELNVDENNEIIINNLYLFNIITDNTSHYNVLEHESDYIAHGFTQLSVQLQKIINIRQLLNCSWTKDDRHTNARSIIQITENFNKTTQLIKTHILQHDKISDIVKALEFWIDVAHDLNKLNNYNVLSMIMGAIENNCVYRLNNCWSKVSKKTKQKRESLCDLVKPSSNYSALRSNYSKDNIIPFMGPFLTELCYIEERNQLNPGEGRVNFKKMRSISKVINPIRKSMNYKFSQPNFLDAYKTIIKFYHQVPYSDKQLEEKSLLIEMM